MAALLDPSAPKENANPTVLTVPSRRVGSRPLPLGSEFVARYNLRRPVDFLGGPTADEEEKKADDGYNSEDGDCGIDGAVPGGPIFSTAAERSAHIALSAAAAASSPSHGRNFVGVLRAAGFVLPPPSGGPGAAGIGTHGAVKASVGSLCRPSFVPASRFSPAADDGSVASPQQKRHSELSRKRDEIDSDEVYEIIRNIRDPEHPLSLEQLGVVRREHVTVVDASAAYADGIEEGVAAGVPASRHRPAFSTVDVRFTPTIPHCSMATLIGLCLRVKLLRSLPRRFKVTVRIEPGTHASETAVNRQLDDKERVCAALENDHLRGVVDKCIADGMRVTTS